MTVVAPDRYLNLAVGLAEGAQRVRPWPGLGRIAPEPFRLIVVEDSAALAALSRGRAPGWGAAITLPGIRTIALRADLPRIEQTFRHELGHLVLHEAIRVRVPLWFDEGYAAWGSGELDRFERLQLNLAVASGRVPDLRELDGMLRGAAGAADLGYALAASAVSELARAGINGELDSLMARLARGEDFQASVLATTGRSVPQFEQEWRRRVRRQYGWFTWLVAGGIWTVMAVVLGGLVWWRRRADRPRRAALDEGWVVPPEDPAPVDPEGERQ